MQTAIVGNTGGGKSYHAAEIIIEELAKARYVVTNIPMLNIESPFLLQWDWDYLKPEWKGEEYPKGALFVLDECWRGIPSGLKVSDIPVRTMEFFKEQRHNVDEKGRSNDVILVTQDLRDIASAIRDLCKFTTLCVKPSDIGQDGLSIRYIHNGAIKGLEPVKSKLIKTQTVKLKAEVFNFYKSHTKSDSVVLGASEGTQKITIFSGWKFKAYLMAIAGAVLFGGWSITHLMGAKGKYVGGDEKKAPVVEVSPGQPVVTVVAPAPAVKPEPLKESENWRVSGDLQFNGRHWVLLSNGSGTGRKIDSNLCKNKGGQLVCEYNGEIVASWTGQKSLQLRQVDVLQASAGNLMPSFDVMKRHDTPINRPSSASPSQLPENFPRPFFAKGG